MKITRLLVTKLAFLGLPLLLLLASSMPVSFAQDTGSAEMVKDIYPGSLGSDPHDYFVEGAWLANLNGTLFFAANNSPSPYNVELWRSDGTEAGTNLVADLGPGSSCPKYMTAVNGRLFFGANSQSTGLGLYSSDGTEPGTVLLKNRANIMGISLPSRSAYNLGDYVTSVDGILYFAATTLLFDGQLYWNYGVELWRSDGTVAGTYVVKDIYPGPGSSNPDCLANVNGTLYFAADDGVHGVELWKSDGTAGGTVMVKDINPNSIPYKHSYPKWLTNVNGTLYFTAYDGVHGVELWKSDGTEAGTVMVKEIFSGTSDSNPAWLTNVNGTLFFAATDTTGDRELWRSDGTEAGTFVVKDINPTLGTSGSTPLYLKEANGTLFFQAFSPGAGRELWRSDGTEAGTYMVKDINPTGGISYPDPATGWLTSVGDFLLFAASDGTHGYELWQSDGTEAGTFMVEDINPTYTGSTPNDSWPGWITSINGAAFFIATDGVHGRELWKYTVYTPPELSTTDATDVNSNSATLNGNLTSRGTVSSVQVYFEWATDAYYTNNGNTYSDRTASSNMDVTGPFSTAISGLSPFTTYHFRAVGVGDCTGYGNDMTFTTAEIIPPISISIVESVGVTDSVQVIPPVSINVAEQFDVSDSVQATPGVYISIIEQVGVTDSVQVIPPASINVAEQVGVADSVEAMPGIYISIVEQVGVADSVEATPGVYISIIEQVGVTDSVQVIPPASINVAEQVGVSDSVEAVPGVYINIIEQVGVTDSVQVIPPVSINVAEQVGVADSVQAVPGVYISIIEQVGVTDSVQVIPPVSIDVAEQVGVTDSVQVIPPASIDVAEQVGVTDSIQVIPLVPVSINVAEQVGVTDSVQVIPPVSINVAEQVGVNDSIQVIPLVPVSINVAEQVGVTDSVQVIPPVSIDVAEQVGVTDSIQVIPPVSINVAEQVGISDSVEATPGVYISIIEQVGVTDSVQVIPPVSINVAEQVGVSDSVEATLGVSALVIQTHSPVDLVVTDPDGLVVDKMSSQIPLATYVEEDVDGDGDLDDTVTIQYPKVGEYHIVVVPELGAPLTDTYTLLITIGNTVITLARDVEIGDIPAGPYVVQWTPEGTVNVRPQAQFSATPLSGDEPLTVAFTDQSTSYDGISSWSWDFGDGVTSTEQNPTHQYAQDGSYTVSLTVTEADLDSDTETKTDYITVYPVNHPPTAVSDAYSVDEDRTLAVAAPGVLSNDTDADGNSLTAVLDTDVKHGTLALNSDGSFVYIPTANYNGTDSFTYKANDGQADSDAATVTITVKPVNDAPVAMNDAYYTGKNAKLSVLAPGVLGNDSDVDRDPLTAILVKGTSHGTLNLNRNGSFTYTPDRYIGTDIFTYRANDGTAHSNTATVTIGINVDPYLINAPSNLIAVSIGRIVILAWRDNSDNEEGFYIERATKTGSGYTAFTRVGQVGTNVPIYIETVSSGTFKYRVQAFNQTTGRVSGYSNEASVVVR